MSNTMKMQVVVVGVLGLVVGLLGGCNEGAPIDLTYIRPAKFEIPTKVKSLAVAEFVCTEHTNAGWGTAGGGMPAILARGGQSDTAWGSVAADKLSAELDSCNREFKRFKLVDRQNLSNILKEKDITIMVKTSADAQKVGKIADVQAIIYGTVVVKCTDEMAQKMVFNIFAFQMLPKFYTKRYVYVSVNLTMDDVDNTVVLITRTKTQEFDSDKDNNGLASVLGFSSDTPEPRDKTINKVLDMCVNEFVQEISIHRIQVQEHLESGKGKLVDRGNTLAAAREYAEALECYKKALAENQDDDGAAFNAGLMCEATGDMSKADEYYTKAFDLNTKEKYVKARTRVRDEAKAKQQAKVEVSAIWPK